AEAPLAVDLSDDRGSEALELDVADAARSDHQEVDLVRVALGEEVRAEDNGFTPALQGGEEVIEEQDLRLEFERSADEEVDRCVHTLPRRGAGVPIDEVDDSGASPAPSSPVSGMVLGGPLRLRSLDPLSHSRRQPPPRAGSPPGRGYGRCDNRPTGLEKWLLLEQRRSVQSGRFADRAPGRFHRTTSR